MSSFVKARTQNAMTAAQRKQFERSYQSYLKYYNKQGQSFETAFTKSDYFEEYKLKYRELKSQGKTVAAIPRQIASDQKYERSWAQDRAQYNALKESDAYKKLHGDKTFTEFRRMQQADIDNMLWDEIAKNRLELKATGMDNHEIDTFISAYYFGSPI